jgi:hypothetical protein
MDMSYRFPTARVHELINAPKGLTEGETVKPGKRGTKGLGFKAFLEVLDGSFVDLTYLGKAGVSDNPHTYDATLLLDQARIRGVGYCPVGRNNFRAKQRIPAGWHQNLVDPSQPTNSPSYNRHDSLSSFDPVDFESFTRKCAELWNIDLAWEPSLL